MERAIVLKLRGTPSPTVLYQASPEDLGKAERQAKQGSSPIIMLPLGESPHIWRNDNPANAVVIISGGAVTSVSLSRDGNVWVSTGTLAGGFVLAPEDQIRIGFIEPPTVTVFP